MRYAYGRHKSHEMSRLVLNIATGAQHYFCLTFLRETMAEPQALYATDEVRLFIYLPFVT